MCRRVEVRRRSVSWRVLALCLALLPLEGTLTTVAAAMVSPHAGHCTDHLCSCMKRCPPKRPATRTHGCHGSDQAPAGPFFQSAGCHHEQEIVGPVMTRPHLFVAAVAVDPGFESSGVSTGAAAWPLAGFRPIDLQPPKARA
jgi:hypothetical protein